MNPTYNASKGRRPAASPPARPQSDTLLGERVIRTELMKSLSRKGVIVPEVAICQEQARVDVALLNTDLHGYEIKSDFDSLRRLPRQLHLYGQACGTVTVVCTSKWVDQVLAIAPEWVGITIPSWDGRNVQFLTYRPAQPNPGRDLAVLTSLLWRIELRDELSLAGAKGVSKLRRHELVRRLVDITLGETLLANVMKRLRKRDWRGHNQEALDG